MNKRNKAFIALLSIFFTTNQTLKALDFSSVGASSLSRVESDMSSDTQPETIDSKGGYHFDRLINGQLDISDGLKKDVGTLFQYLLIIRYQAYRKLTDTEKVAAKNVFGDEEMLYTIMCGGLVGDYLLCIKNMLNYEGLDSDRYHPYAMGMLGSNRRITREEVRKDYPVFMDRTITEIQAVIKGFLGGVKGDDECFKRGIQGLDLKEDVGYLHYRDICIANHLFHLLFTYTPNAQQVAQDIADQSK